MHCTVALVLFEVQGGCTVCSWRTFLLCVCHRSVLYVAKLCVFTQVKTHVSYLEMRQQCAALLCQCAHAARVAVSLVLY